LELLQEEEAAFEVPDQTVGLRRTLTLGQDADTEFMSKSFALRSQLQQNLSNMGSVNLSLRHLQPKKQKQSGSDFSKIEADAFRRWKLMVYFLLKIEGGEQSF
jgi:hypothetical protein